MKFYVTLEVRTCVEADDKVSAKVRALYQIHSSDAAAPLIDIRGVDVVAIMEE